MLKLFTRQKAAQKLPQRSNDVDELEEMVRYTMAQIVPADEKTFDWNHYQAITEAQANPGMWGHEFNSIPTIRILKAAFAREQLIHAGCNAIGRQFLQTRFVAFKQTGENKDKISLPALDKLNKPGSEPCGAFWSSVAVSLMLTGNEFIWDSPGGKRLRLPVERMAIERDPISGDIIRYTMTKGVSDDYHLRESKIEFSPSEVIHIKLPNPYSAMIGLSPLIATSLPILIDRYGHEFVVGFFQRGGNTTGIMETNHSNPNQLTRLLKSIMVAFGSRRNMHADKVLPEGVKWVGKGLTMSEIQLQDLLQKNSRRIMADLGVPNILMGDTDSVNYANAEAQMKSFWYLTIIPLQKMICSALMHSPLWAGVGNDITLCIDNSEVPYLDDFRQRLEDDSKLASTWTINERRERLGKDPLEDDRGGKLESELGAAPLADPFSMIGLSAEQGETKAPEEEAKPLSVETQQAPEQVEDEPEEWKSAQFKEQDEAPAKTHSLFAREFAEWESLVLKNITDKEAARVAIAERAEAFAEKLAENIMPKALAAYDSQLALVKTAKGHARFRTKETQQDRLAKLEALRERAKAFMAGEIRKDRKTAFLGYSETMMERVYKMIEESLASGNSLDAVSSDIRKTFGQFYEGQALTIARTEYQASLAKAWERFGSDLATVSKKMSKKWLTKMDDHTRDSHKALNNMVLRGESSEVPEMTFSKNLRYPKDSQASAEEVINCRCVVSYRVDDWGED